MAKSTAKPATVDQKKQRAAVDHRYENLHILNDFALAFWFLVGSICFFYAHLTFLGTWLFVIGSAQMMIGPLIRVAHKLHIKRLEERIEEQIESFF